MFSSSRFIFFTCLGNVKQEGHFGQDRPLTEVKGGPEPLLKEINEILVRNARIDFRTPFFELVLTPVWFVFRTCFASAISVRPRGTCESSRRIAGVEGVPFMYATSDRLDTWPIPSRTTGSRQYHGSTMV